LDEQFCPLVQGWGLIEEHGKIQVASRTDLTLLCRSKSQAAITLGLFSKTFLAGCLSTPDIIQNLVAKVFEIR
jgi:hypothetical protein